MEVKNLKYVFCFILSFFIIGIFFLYKRVPVVRPKPLIVTTTGMIADLVSNLVGHQADVVALMGPGVDPHMYRARPSDIDRFNEASLIIYNGLHLEGKMADLFSQMSISKKVIALGDLVDRGLLINIGNELYDPHIWHNVALWATLIDSLTTILKDIVMDQNMLLIQSKQYKDTLCALDADIQAMIVSIPEHRRILVTAHDAFSYFGKRYNVTVCGLQGVSTASQAGLYDVCMLAQYIVDNNISTIFVESCVAIGSMHVLQEAVARLGSHVVIGPELYADALGEKALGHDTYSAMIKANVDNIIASWRL